MMKQPECHAEMSDREYAVMVKDDESVERMFALIRQLEELHIEARYLQCIGAPEQFHRGIEMMQSAVAMCILSRDQSTKMGSRGKMIVPINRR